MRAMSDKIIHRGPDDAGSWIDPVAGIAFAHRRLSIVDLSPAGHQPMVSPCDRYVLIYNGEIYNHLEIRDELEKAGGEFDWRGHSDTETLLAALRYWGVEITLGKLNGMFAFALWDRSEKTLFLARDRMGEKPLYFGTQQGNFVFGSELKALMEHPESIKEIDRDALALYMRHKYIPAPHSIYKNVNKLLPGHYLVIRNGGKDVGAPQCYWDLKGIVEKAALRQARSRESMISELEILLLQSVKSRMMSDVPLGAFLSGGIDSSMVVSAMQAQSGQAVRTFSIGFNEASHNEAHYAKAVAEHLGTNHTELYVSPKEALSVIPDLPAIWDEPFSDSSQIPTLLVSKLAKKDVTVCLSGDGGDELFYGYDRYEFGRKSWANLCKLPQWPRPLLASMLERISASNIYKRLPFDKHRMGMIAEGSDILRMQDSVQFYHRLVSLWQTPSDVVINGNEPKTAFSDKGGRPLLTDMREMMMYLDSVSYLPDDILTKVDRAGMSVGLEGRIPLLDHRLVEFSWQVPMKYKRRHGQGKWLLRQVLSKYVPKHLIDRPKMGFGVPIEHWLRGPLREWAEELLSENRLQQDGFFDPKPIRKMWAEHISGQRRWHSHLWSVLMFQAWYDETSRQGDKKIII